MSLVKFKQGSFTEDKIKNLKEGELFFDTDGNEGVWLGTDAGGVQIAKGGIEVIDLR